MPPPIFKNLDILSKMNYDIAVFSRTVEIYKKLKIFKEVETVTENFYVDCPNCQLYNSNGSLKS